MVHSRCLPVVLLLGACATSSSPPTAATTAAPRSADPAPPAAAPAAEMWSDFFAGLPRARSRTGRYELGLARVAQVPHGAGSVAFELQARLGAQDPDVLLDWGPKPVRRLVMNDGTELSYPEQHAMGSPGHGMLAAFGMDVFHEHTGVWDLVLDATVVEVLRWQEFVRPALGVGQHEGLALGPFDIGVEAKSDALSVAFFSIEGRRFDAWAATLEQPVLNLVTHRFAAEAVEVTDAAGRRVRQSSGGGSGGATAATFRHDDGGAIAYPVRLRLRLPVQYRLEISAFRWQDVPLLPLSP